MLYNRMWFKKDRFALTLGGGQINNPGRYLVLAPPIQRRNGGVGGDQCTLLYWNPSDPIQGLGFVVTFDYMPSQYITFRWEYDYRHASVPYWSGSGGVTPPGRVECLTPTTDIRSSSPATTETRRCNYPLEPAQSTCGSQGSSVWFPDLRRDEQFFDIDIMVKF